MDDWVGKGLDRIHEVLFKYITDPSWVTSHPGWAALLGLGILLLIGCHFWDWGERLYAWPWRWPIARSRPRSSGSQRHTEQRTRAGVAASGSEGAGRKPLKPELEESRKTY